MGWASRKDMSCFQKKVYLPTFKQPTISNLSCCSVIYNSSGGPRVQIHNRHNSQQSQQSFQVFSPGSVTKTTFSGKMHLYRVLEKSTVGTVYSYLNSEPFVGSLRGCVLQRLIWCKLSSGMSVQILRVNMV